MENAMNAQPMIILIISTPNFNNDQKGFLILH